jgi:hypothetical protein
MSASSSAPGSSLTKVSVMNSVCSGQHQRVHRGHRAHARAAADDVAHMVQVLVVAADQAADHRVGLAAAQHQAEISVFERRTAALATSGVTPSRAIRLR